MNLVTGATGFLGSYLVKHLLKHGEKVRATYRPGSDFSLLGDAKEQVEWVEADVLDVCALQEAMRGINHLYHCAAVVSFLPREYEVMMKVNVEGTANVMNIAMYAGVKKVMHVSSVAALGFPNSNKVIDENHIDPSINNRPAYYVSKHYGEREAWRAAAEGLEVVVVCPSTILGAGWWDEPPNSIFRLVHEGLNFYTGATHGFVDVRDTAACMYELMQSGQSSRKRFIITSANMTLKSIIDLISESLGVSPPRVHAGDVLLGVAWRLEGIKSLITGKSPVITRDMANISATSFSFSNRKISEFLGYTFRPVEDTIRQTAAAYLDSVRSGKNYGTFT
ncbi:MAG: NAD-dependent epimerase/dehydratase family protein [Chitinophagales bacterium]|nr:NAD-dependent epimerase/dehydratase family protein [Chitinophagales bacterium]MDW8418336.1 NAD-dependent epimerase/dehydratase family protein [Chitinophagales bacterium]